MGTAAVGSELAHAFAADRAAVLGAVLRRTGDLQLAEDAVQEAFAAALRSWGRDGVPDDPRGWLTTTAWRKAIDRMRAEGAARQRAERVGIDRSQETIETVDVSSAEDDLLVLVLACAHPALSHQAGTVLTLRSVLDVPTEAIGHLFGVSTAAMAQQIVRAKRKIRQAGIRPAVPEPAEIPERLTTARSVIHLLLTHGHAARRGDTATDLGVLREALWLARELHHVVPADDETRALLALTLFTVARAPARVAADGSAVLLQDQDRTRWDHELIAEGQDLLASVPPLSAGGSYRLEALIAAEHCTAPSPEETNWVRLAALHGALVARLPSPAARVAHAVAVGEADGPHAGLRLLAHLATEEEVEDMAIFHAAAGRLLRTAGEAQAADEADRRAREATTNPAHRTAMLRAARRAQPPARPPTS
ncbi:RNA polymerase sigma factor [Euzebya tangerina]|uniref:RNA polymerase sigma factor n=1 Tax=Euzebya tangerina TaxID=591198 RepID=UPI000E31C611|nr:DUF6596 domain-containing protein [Euzebya tangerina]